MPLLQFRCNACDSEFESWVKSDEHKKPLSEPCPHCNESGKISRELPAFSICDPARIGIKKVPADFDKYVLGRIKSSVPNNVIGKGARSLATES